MTDLNLLTCRACGARSLELESVQCAVCKQARDDFVLEAPGYSSKHSMTHFSKCRPMSAWASRNMQIMQRLHGVHALCPCTCDAASIAWTSPTRNDTFEAFLHVGPDNLTRLFVRCVSVGTQLPCVVSSVFLLHPSNPSLDKPLGGVVVLAHGEEFSNDRAISKDQLEGEYALCGLIYLGVKFAESTEVKTSRRYRRL